MPTASITSPSTSRCARAAARREFLPDAPASAPSPRVHRRARSQATRYRPCRSRLGLRPLACPLRLGRHDQAQILLRGRSCDVDGDANHVSRPVLAGHLQPRRKNIVSPTPVANALDLLDVPRHSPYQSDPLVGLSTSSGAYACTSASSRQRQHAAAYDQTVPCRHVVDGV